MKNIKDTLTTICGILIAASGAVMTINQTSPGFLPEKIVTIATVAGVAALSVLGYLTGKNPDGSTKSAEQVAKQNEQAK